MDQMFEKYFFNCFLLMLPVLVWDIVFTEKLPQVFQPEIFWHSIPASLSYTENISRTLLFALTLMMPLRIEPGNQRGGLLIYIIGLILYFVSWSMIILYPGSEWSNGILGFLAPAYTPALWLLGIGLIGKRFYFNLPYSRLFYGIVAATFLVAHNIHTYLVFSRLN